MKDKYIVIITSTGTEVLGEVGYKTDHMIGLKSPVVLPDIEQLILMGDYVVYTKDDQVNFNRDSLIAEYIPSDEIVALYVKLLKHEVYTMTRELVSRSIATEVTSLDEVDQDGMDKLAEIMKAPNRFMEENPKILTTEDILRQIHGDKKKKLN